jgi:hypothetical protein
MSAEFTLHTLCAGACTAKITQAYQPLDYKISCQNSESSYGGASGKDIMPLAELNIQLKGLCTLRMRYALDSS